MSAIAAASERQPAISNGRDIFRGGRTSLPPQRLAEITDALTDLPNAIEYFVVLEPGENGVFTRREAREISRWVDILEDAKSLELMNAPAFWEYVIAVVSVCGAVGGLGMAFSAPLAGQVVASLGLIVGAIGAASAFAGGGALMRKEMRCHARLRAIEDAIFRLHDALSAPRR